MNEFCQITSKILIEFVIKSAVTLEFESLKN